MSYIYEKIKKIASDKGITIRDVAQAADMTEGGFHAAVKNNSMKIETLQKIADFLSITLTSLFDETTENVSINTTSNFSSSKKNKPDLNLYERLIDEKDKRINTLEKELDYFKDLVKNQFREKGISQSLGKNNQVGESPQKIEFAIIGQANS
jgi:transcriptional regulator with XRE-family HTH domain